MKTIAINAPTSLTPAQVIQHVLTSGRITSVERVWFLNATLSGILLQPDEIEQIHQLFDRLRMGLIKVVD